MSLKTRLDSPSPRRYSEVLVPMPKELLEVAAPLPRGTNGDNIDRLLPIIPDG